MPLSVSTPEPFIASFLTEVRCRLLQLGTGQGPLLSSVPSSALCCGKLTRAWLVHHSASRVGLPNRIAVILALAVELIQAASLAQDDWMDREPRRRSQPALWKTLGAPAAILASTQLIAEAYRLLATELPASMVASVVTVFSRTLATACIGQWKDLTGSAESLTLLAYEELAAQKTGSLLLLPLELTVAASCNKADLDPAWAPLLGVIYQGLNDLENLLTFPQHLPSDLRWQRLSLPLLLRQHAATLSKPPSARRPLNRLAVTALLERLHQDHSIDRALDLIQSRLNRAAAIPNPSIHFLTEKWQAQLDQQRRDFLRQRECFFNATALPKTAPLRIQMA